MIYLHLSSNSDLDVDGRLIFNSNFTTFLTFNSRALWQSLEKAMKGDDGWHLLRVSIYSSQHMTKVSRRSTKPVLGSPNAQAVSFDVVSRLEILGLMILA